MDVDSQKLEWLKVNAEWRDLHLHAQRARQSIINAYRERACHGGVGPSDEDVRHADELEHQAAQLHMRCEVLFKASLGL